MAGPGTIAMPPKLDKDSESQRFEMRVTAAFLKLVDEWRRKQPDIPTRAEAVRRLAEIALKKR